MEIIDKFVEFDKYCKTCEHQNLKESKDPCHECLGTPINVGSKKPINYKEKDEECDLDIVPNEIRKKDLKIVMSNSLGFGGHNGSVIFKEYEE